jgi:hypothetical protein
MALVTSSIQSKLATIFTAHADIQSELNIEWVDANGMSHVARGKCNSVSVVQEEGQPLKIVFSTDDGFDNV